MCQSLIFDTGSMNKWELTATQENRGRKHIHLRKNTIAGGLEVSTNAGYFND